MVVTHACALLVAALLLGSFGAARAVAADDTSNDTWRAPLADKAEAFEQNVLERHWIDGLYPSMVEVAEDGSVDFTTAGHANVAHSINWTAYYLAGECYRWLATQDPEVRRHCDEIFEAIYRCQLVTGVPGLQARGYVHGHGPSYEERGDANHSNDWYQGEGEYSNYRWRGSPSHHNYSGGAYAFGIYYDLVAEGEQKDRAREAIDALVGYWADQPNFVIRKRDGSMSAPILGFTDGKTPNTRIIMAASALRTAHHVTGKQLYLDKYTELTDQYQFRTWRKPIEGRTGFDDGQHVLQHMENMLRIEKDPELLGFYEHVTRDLWDAHRHDRQSTFNYIFYGNFPDDPGKEEALADALWTLQTFPTDRTFRPIMNSIRDDVGKDGGRSDRPLPMYESPWDNEYQWKGHLYHLDGWLSRGITSVAVPSEDGAVIYASDTGGDVYTSVDGAETWRLVSESLPSAARHLSAGPRIRFVTACTDAGLYRSKTGGDRWERLPMTADAGTPQRTLIDPANGNQLYLIASGGVYRSADHGEEWTGHRWESLTENLPPSRERRFHVAFGEAPIVYALLDSVVHRRAEADGVWVRAGDISMAGYVDTYPWFVTHPSDPTRLVSGFKTNSGAMSGSWLSISEDAGETWSRGLPQLYERFRAGGYIALLAGRVEDDIHALVGDPTDGDIFYAGTSDGVMRSTDGGRSWKQHAQGLDIPVVQTLFADATSGLLFAGTPGGLYLSRDRGETWEDANLKLIFDGNTKREVGGAAYLDAYWRGRYYGFITDEQNVADPATWEGHPPTE
jgi:photosystem II stability/assembly factor-like uncharacterized protein